MRILKRRNKNAFLQRYKSSPRDQISVHQRSIVPYGKLCFQNSLSDHVTICVESPIFSPDNKNRKYTLMDELRRVVLPYQDIYGRSRSMSIFPEMYPKRCRPVTRVFSVTGWQGVITVKSNPENNDLMVIMALLMIRLDEWHFIISLIALNEIEKPSFS